MTRKRNQNRDPWEEVATAYEKITDDLRIQYLYPALLKQISMFASDQRNRELTLLDYGCGPGEFAWRVPNRIKNIVLCDKSPKMLEIAEKRLSYLKNRKRYTFLAPNDVVVQDVRCDLALLSLVITTMADDSHVIETLQNLSHALKPSGALISAVPHPCFNLQVIEASAYRKIGFPYRLCIPGPKTNVAVNTMEWHRPLSQLINLHREAGFTINSCLEIFDGIEYYERRGEEPNRFTGKLPVFLILQAQPICSCRAKPHTKHRSQ